MITFCARFPLGKIITLNLPDKNVRVYISTIRVITNRHTLHVKLYLPKSNGPSVTAITPKTNTDLAQPSFDPDC